LGQSRLHHNQCRITARDCRHVGNNRGLAAGLLVDAGILLIQLACKALSPLLLSCAQEQSFVLQCLQTHQHSNSSNRQQQQLDAAVNYGSIAEVLTNTAACVKG
jgi:hypothetical protein